MDKLSEVPFKDPMEGALQGDPYLARVSSINIMYLRKRQHPVECCLI